MRHFLAILMFSIATGLLAQRVHPDIPQCNPDSPCSQFCQYNCEPPTCDPNSCIPSGTEYCINAALSGPNAIALLCANAKFRLQSSVQFTADGQQLYTQGLPTDSTRARLTVVGGFATAIRGVDRSNIAITHIVVDGNRPVLGHLAGGEALMELGGNSVNQTIDHIDALEPRGWSCLHLIGGSSSTCTGGHITNNKIGPAGQPDGTWADGISLECRSTDVSYNTITDATDGAIVIFSAPGSSIHNNTIVASSRSLLGGINMVDTTYGGDYTGTTVSANTINAQGSLIKVALAMGARIWSCPASTTTNVGATVTGNTLLGSHMGYGFAVDGVSSWTVTGNVDSSSHTGTVASSSCNSTPPAPQGFVKHSIHATGVFQSQFVESPAEYLLGIH